MVNTPMNKLYAYKHITCTTNRKSTKKQKCTKIERQQQQRIKDAV